MERLWTPWRLEYVSSGVTGAEDCLFCWAGRPDGDDADCLVLHRGRWNFVIINKYPYSNGHLMVAPFRHVADLASSELEHLTELMSLARSCERILTEAYHPAGFNLGLNIGRAAGAGVVGHLHLHVVPRWDGDSSFMTTTAQTRVVPETSEGTYERLRPAFEDFHE